MHFKTPAVSMPIDPVEKFLEKMGHGEHLGSNIVEITADDLGDQQRIIVLDYED